MTTDPDWAHYRAFLAVIREGSLSAAARHLGLTQPTIGRQIQALEAALATSLFTRSPSGLLPTEVARALIPQAEAMAAAADALRRAATGARDDAAGLVRITASDIIGAEVLPPILAALRQTHPRLDIALRLTNRVEDLLRRDADIAVRMARPAQSALRAQRIAAIPLGLYAHTTYLARHPAPATPEDLATHSIIGFDEGTPYLRAMITSGIPFGNIPFALRTDNDLAALAALRAGLGIGVCQTPLAAQNPSLHPVLPHLALPTLETWVVMHEDLAPLRRTRTVFDTLVHGLGVYAGVVRK